METIQVPHTRHGRLPGWLRGFQNLTLPHTNEFMTYRGIYDDTTYNPLLDVFNTTFDDVIYSDANHSTLNYNGTLVAASGVDKRVYIWAAIILILFCTISIAINIVVLSSVFFMRSRVYPTLYISLSLAGADTISLLFLALGLFFFSLLPRLGIHLYAPCMFLLLEALRLGAILTTISHLAALAVNHYLGILLPLHYNVYMARRNIQYCIALLWIMPSSLLIFDMFYIEGDGFNTCSYQFLLRQHFRTIFSIPFFGTLGLMIFIYVHIYKLVCKHQRRPLDGRCHRSFNRPRNHGSSYNQVNLKAVVTTIMILGSTVFGWLPAFTYFALICHDCLLSELFMVGNLTEAIVLIIVNVLMIVKTATNSFIYACRMKEIKTALRRMRRRVRMCCFAPQGIHSDRITTEFTRTTSRQSTSRSRTFVYRMNSYNEPSNNNGASLAYSSLRRCHSSTTSRSRQPNTCL